jgi:hypothetical protein
MSWSRAAWVGTPGASVARSTRFPRISHESVVQLQERARAGRLVTVRGVVPSAGRSNRAFDLIEHMMARICAVARSLTARLRWRSCWAVSRPASRSTNTSLRTGRPCSPMRASLGPRASFPRGWTVPIAPALAASGSRSAILSASPCSGSAVRYGIAEPQAARAGDDPPQERNHPQ